jgi:AcrR family transcriptional regulator
VNGPHFSDKGMTHSGWAGPPPRRTLATVRGARTHDADDDVTDDDPGSNDPGSDDAAKRGERLRKGRTLAERRQERRDALLAAALEVFGTKGYAASSVEEICRRAYVSSRNFYEEFDNREDLLQALGDEITKRTYRAMTQVEVEPGPDLVQRRTRARMSQLVHTLVDDPRVARIAIVERVGISDENEARRRQAHHLYAEWIQTFLHDELEAKGISEARQHALALALVGAVNELIGDWVLRPPDQRTTVDELVETTVELVMIMLQRPTNGAGSNTDSTGIDASTDN